MIHQQKSALELSIKYLKRSDESQTLETFEQQLQSDLEDFDHHQAETDRFSSFEGAYGGKLGEEWNCGGVIGLGVLESPLRCSARTIFGWGPIVNGSRMRGVRQ